MVGIRRHGAMADLKVSIPLDLKREFELLIADPRKGKKAYGYSSLIITDLLSKWCADKRVERAELLGDAQ